MRGIRLHNVLHPWVSFLKFLRRHVDTVNQNLATTAPDKNVLDDAVKPLEPLRIGVVCLVVVVLLGGT